MRLVLFFLLFQFYNTPQTIIQQYNGCGYSEITSVEVWQGNFDNGYWSVFSHKIISTSVWEEFIGLPGNVFWMGYNNYNEYGLV